MVPYLFQLAKALFHALLEDGGKRIEFGSVQVIVLDVMILDLRDLIPESMYTSYCYFYARFPFRNFFQIFYRPLFSLPSFPILFC